MLQSTPNSVVGRAEVKHADLITARMCLVATVFEAWQSLAQAWRCSVGTSRTSFPALEMSTATRYRPTTLIS